MFFGWIIFNKGLTIVLFFSKIGCFTLQYLSKKICVCLYIAIYFFHYFSKHVGDMGNVEIGKNGSAVFRYEDDLIKVILL